MCCLPNGGTKDSSFQRRKDFAEIRRVSPLARQFSTAIFIFGSEQETRLSPRDRACVSGTMLWRLR